MNPFLSKCACVFGEGGLSSKPVFAFDTKSWYLSLSCLVTDARLKEWVCEGEVSFERFKEF